MNEILECGSSLPLYWRQAGFAREGASKLAHSKDFFFRETVYDK
jgi:hypothetical protein